MRESHLSYRNRAALSAAKPNGRNQTGLLELVAKIRNGWYVFAIVVYLKRYKGNEPARGKFHHYPATDVWYSSRQCHSQHTNRTLRVTLSCTISFRRASIEPRVRVMLIKISLEIEQVCLQISAVQKSVSSRHSRRIVPISGSMNGCDRAGT